MPDDYRTARIKLIRPELPSRIQQQQMRAIDGKFVDVAIDYCRNRRWCPPQTYGVITFERHPKSSADTHCLYITSD